ncbi:peroxisomal sarcosine oxidase isoform X1 [Canis lupus baileyi]|uniref:Peroxisomal sarcosine oxidase n=4 Tax=Canis lupus TaxID=9612 RepID=A0A8C0MVR2_CANLF|nr:peroxisomal sarcosine oxidase isoform X1 [Canis lupus dingo]XP_038404227.1 peroxisomal sarcosine oxidase isoform X1 [Canis lupus familiaris]XP_038533449.1 peroxisomal sarcosine oxidase isoform X1 [Canis lupus familiaris]XP_548297.2 peroxisomal sarcosine oxidase isoform X1 [Canis lupus familiaris]|eukprot:XP_548297.2 peroxisomal sarcosine oxidase isoform X1 [Canis lupus familiaris]
MAAQKVLCDAIVIGAGIQGCFTAYHLAKHRKKVILLEQFFLPHSRGSSHGQSRIIRRAYLEDFYTQMMDECYQIWAQLEHEAETQLHRQTGLLMLGMKENSELKTIQATLSRHRVEHQYFSAEELKQRFPNVQLARGEVGLLEKSGGVLYADRALRALQDAIRRLGGQVHDGEKVMEIKPGLPVIVKSTSRSYQAKSLIITVGPWTNRLLRPLGIELPLQTLRINVCYWPEKVPGSYGVSQAFPCFLVLDLSLTPHHIYGLPSGEYPGLMKVCYHHGNNADPEERDCPEAFSDIQDVQILSRFIRDHLPDLEPKPAILEHCLYTNTPDGHCILDRHPKYDNIVIGAGFSGHGFKLAPVVGKILCELSMKLTPSYDLTPFRMSRFPGLGKAHL